MKKQKEVCWSGPLDGPWPNHHVGGDLENAEQEWLATNDVGAYAMSTLALMHTRRQHGLLVCHIGDDPGRYVVLSHLEMTLETGGRTFHLSTHQFPNVAPTPGYRHLEDFTQDPIPRWMYRFPTGTVERTVSLVPGHSAVVIALTWQGKKPARLTLRPLMPMRHSEELCQEHGGMLQKVVLRSGEVEVQPNAKLPPVSFRHSGVFMGSPDWWRKFEYLADRGRYNDFQEDMWSPGTFELNLTPRETQYLVVSTGAPPVENPPDLVMEAAQELLNRDSDQHLANELRALRVAADAFAVQDGETVLAGYPWLGTWSRDTLLSIPGLFLARGQVGKARRALRNLLENLHEGLLPQRLDALRDVRGLSADSSLWLFDVGKKVLEADPHDEEFQEELRSALLNVFLRVTEGEHTLWLNEEGFVENAGEAPLTWMDSRTDDVVYAARWGLAVELQALWARACQVFAELSEQAGDHQMADRARKSRQRLVENFSTRFWCDDSSYPFDCVSGSLDGEDWADASVRPNAVIALAVAPELFESWQRKEIIARADELLLTSHGLRSLDPNDRRYVGHGGGTIADRRAASHQGTAWPHLLLYYVRASLREGGSEGELRDVIRSAMESGLALGHVTQSADGDSPHRYRGSPAYAMATAMLLEALVVDLNVGVEGRALW